MHDFHMSALMFLTDHGIKAITHVCVEIAHFLTRVHHQNLENTWPAALCFPGPDDAPCWEMCDFPTGMGFCFNTTWKILNNGSKVCQMLSWRWKNGPHFINI